MNPLDMIKELMGGNCKNYEKVRPLTHEERDEWLKVKIAGETAKKAALEHHSLKNRFWANMEISTKIYDKGMQAEAKGKGEFVVMVHKCEGGHEFGHEGGL